MTPEAAQDGPHGPTVYDRARHQRPVPAETIAPGGDVATRTVDGRRPDPSHLAEKICEGFLRHDRRDREGAVEAFFEVDRHQFAHLDDEAAREAAEAFVDALWAKDAVERAFVESSGSGEAPETFDDDGLAAADWSEVAAHLDRRAAIVGMDPAYATATAVAWRRHKTGGDYWTPTLRAQAHEVRAAMDPDDAAADGTAKNRHGQSGFGHLPARYLVGVELHDMRTSDHWAQAVAVMTPYYAEILAAHREGRNA